MIHRGFAVAQPIGGQPDLVGPAVNVAHRLLKNTVRSRVGAQPYLLLSQPAAAGLGQPTAGIDHVETYPDVGPIDVRIVDLAEVAGVSPNAAVAAAGSQAFPEIAITEP